MLHGYKVPSKPYEYQKDVPIRIIEGTLEGKNLHVLIAPAGAGKTYAVVKTFVEGYKDYIRPRMFHVLPTRSLAYRFYKEYIEGYFGGEVREGVNRQRVKGGLIISLERGHVSGSKFMMATDVVISTRDTFLYSLVGMRVRDGYVDVPFGNIAGSLVVLDEVQMLQDEYAYGPRIMRSAVKALVEAGATVLIITATLPSRYLKMLSDFEPTVYVVGTENPYEYSDVILYSEDVGRIAKRRVSEDKYRVSVTQPVSGVEEMLNMVGEKLSERISDGKTLIVMNTVNNAIEVYKRIREKYSDAVLIHSRFVVEDREMRERMLDEARVIVATQVVEAGLDVKDIKYVLTELAPIDALIQRIGRAGRSPEVGSCEALVVPIISVLKEKKEKREVVLPYYYISDHKRLLEIVEKNLEEFPKALSDASVSTRLVDEGFELVEENISTDVLKKLGASVIALENLSINAIPDDFAVRPREYVEIVPKEKIEEKLGKLKEGLELEKNVVERMKLTLDKELARGLYAEYVLESKENKRVLRKYKIGVERAYRIGRIPVVSGYTEFGFVKSSSKKRR